MEEKRIYPSAQLIALLHPTVLKVYLYLLSWQKLNTKAYVKPLSKVLKLSEKKVEISIQTLIDNKLIQVNGYEIILNREEALKYFEIPFTKVNEMDLLPISTEVTWTKKSDFNSIEDLSESQIKTLILRLQASLNEKEQLKKLIKTAEPTDLPF